MDTREYLEAIKREHCCDISCGIQKPTRYEAVRKIIFALYDDMTKISNFTNRTSKTSNDQNDFRKLIVRSQREERKPVNTRWIQHFKFI